jgi:hypothetical protein
MTTVSRSRVDHVTLFAYQPSVDRTSGASVEVHGGVVF